MRPPTLKSALAVTGIAAAFVALSIGVFQIDRHEKQNMKTASVVVSSASVVSSENADNVLTDSVTLVSPFTEYGSREDACAAAETSLDAPDSVPGFAGTRYEAASASEMVQITYGTASPDTGEIMIRQGAGQRRYQRQQHSVRRGADADRRGPAGQCPQHGRAGICCHMGRERVRVRPVLPDRT